MTTTQVAQCPTRETVRAIKFWRLKKVEYSNWPSSSDLVKNPPASVCFEPLLRCIFVPKRRTTETLEKELGLRIIEISSAAANVDWEQKLMKLLTKLRC
ncbi:hypothetical protein NMG60_11020908 [Bertholletia excelsa]